MTEIRKEMASILRKLRNLGYENYELVRTSKEVQCVDQRKLRQGEGYGLEGLNI